MGLILLQRLLELWLANHNRRWLLTQGAKEFGRRHYPLFFLLHAGWLAAWLGEALLAGPDLSGLWPLWLSLFILAQGLRYWCIASLGRCWNTRILVIPGGEKVVRGPYRFVRHPNYLAVAVELACVPLMFNAWVTALTATLANALLLLVIRIPAEEEALRQLTK